MKTPHRLLCILAHPDDETFGTGGLLAKYAAAGCETFVVTATRGERGWASDEQAYPGPDAVGLIRARELQAATTILGVQQTHLLGYHDGLLDEAHPAEVIGQLMGYLRRIRPEVVVTFGPDGGYGHPDHIAISQFTTAALVEAAASDSNYHRDLASHQVAKLYYLAQTEAWLAAYQAIFGSLVMSVDDHSRQAVSWPAWMPTTHIATQPYADIVWQAVACHRSQIGNYEQLRQRAAATQTTPWSEQTLYRAYSLVNGGRQPEDDLFAGVS